MAGKDIGSFCAPKPHLRKRDGATLPWPRQNAQSVVRKGGKLRDAPPSANLWDGWAPGRRGGCPPGTHGPFHGAWPSRVTAGGTEGQDRPGHNHGSVPAASSPHAHTCTNTQLYANPKHTPEQPPTHFNTHANRHLRSPGHPPTNCLAGRETQTFGILSALPLTPDPLWHLPPHTERLAPPRQPTPLTLCIPLSESRLQHQKGTFGTNPHRQEGERLGRSAHFTKC